MTSTHPPLLKSSRVTPSPPALPHRDQILKNTREWLKPRETLYIATDEKNKTFFSPLVAEYNVKYLDDYFEEAGLNVIDPNQYGMIEQVCDVADLGHG